ncbi:NACHT domain- and WD repeat-containing protein 1 [Brienomyrus brachyistius]|uniref:NACHT domain- and WD repeat-containing protein 1 n=1 Tax=Brienomyrus brachyistius TaxID=42636 RepID=UPI0020B194BC|nr:NACHT domain- and WD repeat-containing protein 1 [Brienomyrus brachyistius]XP_048831717.1 NACHT domain- and WD repeat-containing protein 1 [Brienomyrus brachyistius]
MSIKEAVGLGLLMGQLPEDLEIRSNVVRVFISSTFSDMSIERYTLLEKAYPELQAFCQSLGLVFEVVDLKWGVYDAVAVDHMTTELCLEEIRSCKRVSVGPSITVLLGNCYGHRPIPRLIPENEFELLLAKMAQNEEGIRLLRQWFWKDDNSAPPTYVLQPISTHFPYYSDIGSEDGSSHDSDVISWQLTEARILGLLRTAALQASEDGDLSTEQKQIYFKSVSEWEIGQGLLGIRNSNQHAVVFVRELPRLKKNESQGALGKFIDFTANGLVDTEAQDLLSALKSRIYATCSDFLNLHCLELRKGRINPSCKEHAQYLQSFCEQFVSQMKAKIKWATAQTPDQEWCWLLKEISHHLVLSSAKCAVFCGREHLLGRLCLHMWESASDRHSPLVVHGPSGIGKTALLCKLAQEMRGVLGPKAVVVLRLLGSSPLSSDISTVLKSICLQICGACSLPLPNSLTTNNHEALTRFFHLTLTRVSQKRQPLFIILDGLDYLSKTCHAHRLYWLPKEIPPNVHLVVSTQENSQHILNNLEGLIEPKHFFEVEQLTFDQAKDVIHAYMSKVKRRLTPEQHNVILSIIKISGNPLLLMLALNTARRWASYTPVSEEQLGTTLQQAVYILLQGLEKKHGKLLVSSALGYIVSSRDGASEAELRDLLSLDDEVLAEVYRYKLPINHTVVRLPPLLWTRLRHDIDEYLLEKEADGIKVLGFCNRHFTETVQEMYLSSEQRTKRHQVFSEYFLGCWSQGRVKHLQLPSFQTKLNADRKVISQPLWFAEGVANKRKLRELPYHLIHGGSWEELLQEVIGNAEWLWCQTLTCGVASIIEDLSLCLEVHDCPETELVRDMFLLMKPTLDSIEGQMDPSLFYTEIFARLYSLAEMYPSIIGRLYSQCQDWFDSSPNPILVPSCGFFQSPGGPLKTVLTGSQKGITGMDICQEKHLLAAGTTDGSVIVWHLDDLGVAYTLTGHTDAVLQVKIISRGTRCLSLACDGTLRLWSLLSGGQLHILDEFSTDAQLPPQIHVVEGMPLFCSSCGTKIKAWQLETAEPLFQLEGAGEKPIMLGFLGEALAVLSNPGLLTLYDSFTGVEKTQVCLTADHQKLTAACTVTLPARDGLVVGSKEGGLYLVSSQGSHDVARLSSPVSFLVPSGDETLLCAGYEKQVAMFHVQAGSMQRFLAQAFQHEDTVWTAVIPGLRRLLITGSEDHIIREWCLSTGDLLDSFVGMGARVTGLVMYGDTVIAASSDAPPLKLWRLNYNRKHKTASCIPASGPLVTLSRDGERACFLQHGDRKQVVLWDCLTGTPAETIAVSSEVSCMELAQKKKLLFCGVKTGTILIYPLENLPETLCLPPPETLPRVCCMAVSQAEDRMAVAYQESISVFEITERDRFPCVEGPFQTLPLSLFHSPISCMALLSDCRLLKGSNCGQVALYDFKNTCVTSLGRHQTKITCITVSRTDSLALIGSQDSVQRLWSLSPLKLHYTMEQQGFILEGVLCSAFSENGQYIFTGSQDRTIKVWDVISGNLLVIQYVYAPVTTILPYKEGFVAVSQLGHVIKEKFQCPRQVNLQDSRLQHFQRQYRITPREREPETLPSTTTKSTQQKSAQPQLAKTKSLHTCCVL